MKKGKRNHTSQMAGPWTIAADRGSLSVRFRLAQPGDPFALFPLAASLQYFEALKTFEHIPFAAQSGSRAQTTML